MSGDCGAISWYDWAVSTLLIADDSPGKRHLLKAIAARYWPGDVVEAETTEAAIALLPSTPTLTAAFVDYYMPSAHGPAVIRAVRSAFPQAKIALVSSADHAENSAEARAAGADAVVCSSHPESTEQLANLLVQWVAELGINV